MNINKRLLPLYKKVLYVTSVTLLFASCHKEEDSNTSPCAGITRTQAAFKVEESDDDPGNSYFHVPFDYESDTICTGYAQFTVTSQADSVLWKIGANTYTDQSVFIDFSGYSDLHVPITLIVFRKPQLKCYPDDKTSDTLTKVIYVNPSSTRIFGTYRGVWQEAPNDTFTLGVILTHGPYMDTTKIVNFDKTGCQTGAAFFKGYRKAFIQQSYPECSYACSTMGILELDKDNTTVSISYGTGIIDANTHFHRYLHVFKGKRVQ